MATNVKQDNLLEKHYTPSDLIEAMVVLLDEHYGLNNVTEYLENSAGGGGIIDHLKPLGKPIIAYDIYNETHRPDIIEADYLKVKLPYKQGRVAVINPPFHKMIKFLYKTLEEADYVVSVVPFSTIFNLDYNKYEVDAIHVYRKYQFEKTKLDIALIAMRKK